VIESREAGLIAEADRLLEERLALYLGPCGESAEHA
jgi:hypothetical protein